MSEEPREIVIATGNPHKVEEMRAILGAAAAAAGYAVVGLKDLEARGLGPFEEPEEIGQTFEHNAAIKALAYAEQTGRVCVADDSGLEIDALGGAPGVISSHYFNDGRTDGAAAGMGRDERDRRNNQRVLRELAGVEWARRGARFVCVMVVAKGARPRNQLGLRAFRPQPTPASSPAAAPGTFDGRNRRYTRKLPHIEVGAATYFVTFNSLVGPFDETERTIILDACLHWHGVRAWVHIATVMPDHVHLLFGPIQQGDGAWPTLASLMHSIKGFTAQEINRRRGRSGQVWQTEYFDRIMRSGRDARQAFVYVQMNPVAAGLCGAPGLYPWTAIDGVRARGRRLSGPEARNPRDAGRPEARNPREAADEGGGLGDWRPRARVCAVFKGTFEGRIGLATDQTDRPELLVPRGTNGFGYDPLFLVAPAFERTSAEMDAADKNAVSHRARAGEQLAAWLREGGLDG